MTINYKQLKDLVLQELGGDGPGGSLGPSAPEGIPHRMPSADTWDKQQDMGDPKANELYEVALVAREATEKLVEALDEPIFDDAYEHAFKASACLRKALNSIEQSGAHPMPMQRVVAQPAGQQKYSGGSNAGDYAGGVTVGMGNGAIGMEEADQKQRLGVKTLSKGDMARGERDRGAAIAQGNILQGVNSKERAILADVEKVLTKVADITDLVAFRPQLEALLNKILKKADQKA
jgi:hypothetical protein